MLERLSNYIYRGFRRARIMFKWALRGYDLVWWDYTSLLDVMIYQLEDMEKMFRSVGCSTDSKRSANDMARVLKLLKAVRDDNYYVKESEELDKFRLETDPSPDNIIPYTTEEPSDIGTLCIPLTNINSRVYSTRLRNLVKKCESKKIKDLARAMDLIGTNCLKWWD